MQFASWWHRRTWRRTCGSSNNRNQRTKRKWHYVVAHLFTHWIPKVVAVPHDRIVNLLATSVGEVSSRQLDEYTIDTLLIRSTWKRCLPLCIDSWLAKTLPAICRYRLPQMIQPSLGHHQLFPHSGHRPHSHSHKDQSLTNLVLILCLLFYLIWPPTVSKMWDEKAILVHSILLYRSLLPLNISTMYTFMPMPIPS